jgi:hypothetical protein
VIVVEGILLAFRRLCSLPLFMRSGLSYGKISAGLCLLSHGMNFWNTQTWLR